MDGASKRSFTGNHALLPAVRPLVSAKEHVEKTSSLAWSFGRGSVIWRVWPAVLLHTVFAALIAWLHEIRGLGVLAIPNVMLTVLGVVIGFVISYRAMSGYDRYWMGRTFWSDVIKNCRTTGRLVWFHVPPRLTSRTPEEIQAGTFQRSSEEMTKVMAEKIMALDLIEGFAVSLKHHLRGETGIYFEDLYHLVRPLHEHSHTARQNEFAMASSQPPPTRVHRIASNPSLPQAQTVSSPSTSTGYGTFHSPPTLRHSASAASHLSQHRPLQPAMTIDRKLTLDAIEPSLIPFAGLFTSIRRRFKSDTILGNEPPKDPFSPGASQQKWKAAGDRKHRLRPNEEAQNLPLEILRCFSEWLSVLEERGTVAGSSMGPLVAAVAAFEDSLAGMERILTTPLPFVYSVHIRHTVWVYLFFLPFQLIRDFRWYTVPGVCIAAFIYLGFLAAGEEIEQPFGYDDNDLDLDMFCQEIVHVDIENLKKSPCLNAYLVDPHAQQLHRQQSITLTEGSSNGGVHDPFDDRRAVVDGVTAAEMGAAPVLDKHVP